MIEYAVLSSIRSKGLAIGAKLKKPMDLIMFEGAASSPASEKLSQTDPCSIVTKFSISKA
jgi:hypothetical protein